ncbi:MAG: FHA domain-containing protein, partial [Actinomycetota bacterium]|nr:FHA domain-containing protein [Actinomycetota bacterium]
MELLLALLVPERDELASLDVALDVDPADTVADVAAALVDFAESRGYGPFDRDRLTLRAGAARRILPPAQTVVDANLVSGMTVVVEERAGSHLDTTSDGHNGVVSLDVAAGPEAGRFIAVSPGTYRVGRSSACDIVIDDPTMSKHHLTVDVAHDLKVTITPEDAAANGTFMGGAEISGTRVVEPEQLVQAGATALAFRPLGEDFSHRRDLLGQIPFNRVPHHRVVVRERTFDPLERPPETPRKQSFPVLASLLPLAIGVVMVMITNRPQFLLITALSPMMLVGRYVSDRRSGRRAYRTGKADFLKRVEARANEVTAALEEERRERFRAAPDVAELARQARFHHGVLWERQRQDPDLLSLRLGLGDVESKVKAELDRGGDVELREHAKNALAHQSIVRSVPVTVELDELTVLGLFGEDDAVRGLGTSLAMQAACLHSPEDVVVAAAVPEGGVGAFVWLKWLPHTRSATSPLEGDHLAIGADRTNRLLVNLLAVADDRLSRRVDREGGAWPRVLLILHEDAQPDRAILSQLLDVAGPAGIRALWLGHTALQLPRQCRATIAAADPLLGTRSRVRFTDPDRVDREVEIEGVKSDTALEIARSLAPIRDASAATVTTAIPRRVHLLDLLGLPQPDPDEIAQRWKTPRPYGISGALGVAADGPFYLDLVSDGP